MSDTHSHRVVCVISDIIRASCCRVSIALWVIAVALVVVVIGHGFVACHDWTEDGCYQVASDDGQRFEIWVDSTWPDNRVSTGLTADAAWAQAPAYCRRSL